MSEWHPCDTGQFSIAGYQTWDGPWNDVEGKTGDPDWEVSGHTPDEAEIIVVHVITESGDEQYRTIYGPFDDMEGLAAYVDYVMGGYEEA